MIFRQHIEPVSKILEQGGTEQHLKILGAFNDPLNLGCRGRTIG